MFQPGKTYLLRLFNFSGYKRFFFNIDDHDMQIVETDGVSNRRAAVNRVLTM